MASTASSVPFLSVHREINGYQFDPIGNDNIRVTYPNGTTRDLSSRNAMAVYTSQAILPTNADLVQAQQQEQLQEQGMPGITQGGATQAEMDAERVRILTAALDLKYGDNRDYMPEIPDYNPFEARGRRDLGGRAVFQGPILDGHLVTMRNLAWHGTTIDHAWPAGSGTRVSATWAPNGVFTIDPLRMDNRYSWIIRKVTFSVARRAWVMDPDGWKRGDPITKDDYVMFFQPNSPNMVMGTRKPSNALITNANYRVELVDFRILTHLRTTAETVGTFFSLGFYSPESWVTQSRVIWSFQGTSFGPRGELLYGMPLHVVNEYTDAWSYGWGGDYPWNYANKLEGERKSKEFNGGRFLTQAANSDGEVVKLALHNNRDDDKSQWIMDSWYGNNYSVPIAINAGTPTAQEILDSASPSNPHPVQVDVSDLSGQWNDPATPPVAYGSDGRLLEMEWDPVAGVWHAKGLAESTLGQNPRTWWDWIATTFFNKDRWQDLTIAEQGEATLILAGGLLAGGILATKLVEHEIDKT